MGPVSGINGKGKKEESRKEKKQKVEEEEEEEEAEDDDDDDEDHEQDGLSVHSPCKIPQKEKSDVELELKLLEALEIYPPVKLGGVHRHFVLYGLTEYLRRRLLSFIFNRQFTSDDVLKLLDRFYNLEMLKSDDEETEMLNHEEDFCLPPSYFVKEDT